MMNPEWPARSPRWRLEDIDFDAVDPAAVAGDTPLFYIVVAASFVEMASDVYTGNLSRYYADDAEVTQWLTTEWEPEEIQHGRSLRAYARAAWPQFDWDRAYAGFVEEYAARCTLDEFEPTPGLEMAARCVVETGTATLYRMLHAYAREPVLRQLIGHIKADEVRHYSHFYRYFRRYQADAPAPRRRILAAVFRRVAEARNDDAEIAFRHVHRVREPGAPYRPADYRKFKAQARALMRDHFPFEMAVRMLSRPLALPPALQRPLVWAGPRVARRALFV
jgi:hypothetical protein